MNPRAAFMKATQAQAQERKYKEDNYPHISKNDAGKKISRSQEARPEPVIPRKGKDTKLARKEKELLDRKQTTRNSGNSVAFPTTTTEPEKNNGSLVKDHLREKGKDAASSAGKRHGLPEQKNEKPSSPKKARLLCDEDKKLLPSNVKHEIPALKLDEVSQTEATEFLNNAKDFILNASKKAAKRNRDFRCLIRETSTVHVRVPALHRLVLSEAARNERGVDDRIYVSMREVLDKREIFSPEENLPAFSPSQRVGIKSKPIAMKLNWQLPTTYQRRKLVLNAFKGSRKGRHIPLFSCSLSGKVIAEKAADLVNEGRSPSIMLPCVPTKYIKNCQVEFEVTKLSFDARYEERKISETPALLADSLNDGISTVLGCVDLFLHFKAGDDLASHLGAKSHSALLTELLDVAIFLRNRDCALCLLEAGAEPSAEARILSERLARGHYPGAEHKALLSAEINFRVCNKIHKQYT